jgi:hypothetical protein
MRIFSQKTDTQPKDFLKKVKNSFRDGTALWELRFTPREVYICEAKTWPQSSGELRHGEHGAR